MGSRRVVGEVVLGPELMERTAQVLGDADTDLVPAAAECHTDGGGRVAQLDREADQRLSAFADGRLQVLWVSVFELFGQGRRNPSLLDNAIFVLYLETQKRRRCKRVDFVRANGENR